MSGEKRFYNGYDQLFAEEFSKPYFIKLKQFLTAEYATKTIYPKKSLILNAFDHTAYDDVNVVILGQDPYINEGQAMGMSFSVPDGVRPPQSLVNIFREIKDDVGYTPHIAGGNLAPWARQGVLLLNSVLTVEAGKSGSHRGQGWETFTDEVIKYLNARPRGMVFLLWGNYAIAKRHLIKNPQHLVLTAPHPSPLSAYNGFFGCGHFSKANEFLKHQQREILW
jgi:uracil-DNA glycosylase